MYRKSILLVIALVATLAFTACAAPAAAPQASQEAEPTEAAAAEAVPAEEAAPTEAPDEEAVPTEAAVEEAAAADGEATIYAVDTEASVIEWFGSKPIGASESGTVAISEGQLSFNGTELVDGTFMIDMASIETTTQSGNMKNMLEDHLKSEDFFGIEAYPTAMLMIKSVTPTDVENQYSVVADLTIKETTDEITFVTDVVVGEGTLEATAAIVIDRSIYDVRYASSSFFSGLGDDLISDEMEMTVQLVAKS